MPINAPQQLNMADRIALRPSLVTRCTQAVANYALYVLGGGKDADPNVANLKSWAASAIRNAQQTGEAVSWYVLNQTSFLNGGTSIEDAELNGIVEAAINAHFVAPFVEPEPVV